MKALFLYIALMVACELLVSVPVFAAVSPLSASTISGYGEMSYAQFSAEEDGKEVMDASHFVQKYGVLWSKEGEISGGRVGRYDFSLGYEWSWVDSEIDGVSIDIENPLDKVLFKGDALIAPGGLPLRLHLYSYDMESANFVYQELGELFQNQTYDNQLGIVTSLSNGSHVTTGMTLMAGVNNGDYGGRYRDLLVAMPKLLIDFRQDEVRDLKGPTQQYYTDRNLAFVSLNKNKNWFHYRFFTHDDRLNPTSDYETQTFLLGTINHLNRREWVDLTNWIQVSSDLSFSETSTSPDSAQMASKRYDLNALANVYRGSWRGNSYASYSRVRDERSLSKTLSTPLALSGELSRDTTWRLRVESYHSQEDFWELNDSEESSDLYLSSRLDMFRQNHYMIAPTIEGEWKKGNTGEGNAIRGGVEVFTNPRYRVPYELFGSYSVGVFEGQNPSGTGISFVEQKFKGKISSELNRGTRIGFWQEFLVGMGTYSSTVTDVMRAYSDMTSNDAASDEIIDGTTWRSTSTWFLEHRSLDLVSNRLQLVYDYLSSPIDSGGQLTINHNLNYYGRTLDFSLDNELVLSDSPNSLFTSNTGTVLSGSSSGIVISKGAVTSSLSSNGRLGFSPSPSQQHDISIIAEWRDYESGDSDQRYEVDQLYQYTFWKDTGLLRKILVVGEEFEYENYRPSNGDEESLQAFTLFTEYYPTRQTLLGVRLRYEIDTIKKTDTALVFLTAGMDFQKFELKFDYSYGSRTDSEVEPERVEHKWEMYVKKTF